MIIKNLGGRASVDFESFEHILSYCSRSKNWIMSCSTYLHATRDSGEQVGQIHFLSVPYSLYTAHSFL